GAARDEIKLIRNAIDKCGRDMVLSLSPGPASIKDKKFLLENANMWRMTDDFWDDWKLLYNMFDRAKDWEGVGCKDHWPDCDMLPLGRLSILEKEGGGRWTALSEDEQKIMMTLWCIFRSPLIFGGDLRENDEFTNSLLTNERLLDMHKKGRKPRQIYRKNDLVIWKSRSKDGRIFLAIFNIGEKTISHKIKFSDLGLPGTEAGAVDIWSGSKGIVKDKESVEMKPHSVECYEIEAPEETVNHILL
ncbi:MAG: alpha-galactosidase, partial [Butyrivibrio sp.]|nr:alpha-galactosidase [Butyrivibrio sp.]